MPRERDGHTSQRMAVVHWAARHLEARGQLRSLLWEGNDSGVCGVRETLVLFAALHSCVPCMVDWLLGLPAECGVAQMFLVPTKKGKLPLQNLIAQALHNPNFQGRVHDFGDCLLRSLRFLFGHADHQSCLSGDHELFKSTLLVRAMALPPGGWDMAPGVPRVDSDEVLRVVEGVMGGHSMAFKVLQQHMSIFG